MFNPQEEEEEPNFLNQQPPPEPAQAPATPPTSDSKLALIASYLTKQKEAATVPPASPAQSTTPSAMNWKSNLGVALAGLGDAFAGAAGRPANNADQALSIVQNAPKLAEERRQYQRTAAQQKEMDNPSSGTTKQYIGLAAQLTGKDPSEFNGMNGTQIANVLPITEKMYAVNQETEAKKEVGKNAAEARIEAANIGANAQLETAKATLALKESVFGNQMDKHQDQLEKNQVDRLDKGFSNRSGGLGLEDMKVNAAITAGNLLRGSRDPKTGQVNVNQLTAPEFALSLSNIISGGKNGGNIESFKAMQPQALSADIKSKIGYLLGKPVDVLPQQWVKALSDMLDRQGTTAEDLRDKYYEDINKTAPSQLDPDRLKRIMDVKRGNSYREAFGIQKGQNSPSGDTTPNPNETVRKTADGKMAVFDNTTKKFLRYQ